MLYSKQDVEAGTKLIEELFNTWATDNADNQMDLDDDDGQAQLQSLRSCFEKYLPQLDANPWCKNMIEEL